MKRFVEFFGWYGAAAILLSYTLVSFSLLQPDNVWYAILNGTGALGIIAVSYSKGVYQSVLLNLVWFLIACVALFTIL